MSYNRRLFFKHVAQTSDFPIGAEIIRASGIYLFGPSGEKFIDLVSGVSVSSLGHNNQKIIEAIHVQTDNFLHLTVYGEFIQSPQVILARMLADNLPENLNCTYFVNSGSEAVEGAMKLAKRYTGRKEIISFKNAYHGSTQGALSILGDESFKKSFRPLLPQIRIINYNDFTDLSLISDKTAAVFVEPVQAEAGVVQPKMDFLKKLRKKCNETGTLLVFDEIQTGMGRLGALFAFEKYDVVPDILLTAKALGGGMPLGAFISSKKILDSFKTNPVLGHITTFGGHPVSCAAAIAMLKQVKNKKILDSVLIKEGLFKQLLVHEKIKEVRGEGLLLAVDLGKAELVKKFVKKAIEKGIITEWFLFDDKSFRISPPLNITQQEIRSVCKTILDILSEF